MTRSTANFATTTALLALLLAMAGPARAQYRDPGDAPPPPVSGDGATVRTTPYHYSSTDGHFQVTWPSGCGELRIRANEPENFAGEEPSDVVLVHHVSCDRFGVEGEGCSVVATFEAKNAEGGPAGPEQVLSRVKNMLKVYGVQIVKQVPVKREFPDGLIVEGVDVLGTGPDGKGEFWVRGLLSYHDIYVLTAWSAKSDLWDNPSFHAFFNEFVPYAE